MATATFWGGVSCRQAEGTWQAHIFMELCSTDRAITVTRSEGDVRGVGVSMDTDERQWKVRVGIAEHEDEEAIEICVDVSRGQQIPGEPLRPPPHCLKPDRPGPAADVGDDSAFQASAPT